MFCRLCGEKSDTKIHKDCWDSLYIMHNFFNQRYCIKTDSYGWANYWKYIAIDRLRQEVLPLNQPTQEKQEQGELC